MDILNKYLHLQIKTMANIHGLGDNNGARNAANGG